MHCHNDEGVTILRTYISTYVTHQGHYLLTQRKFDIPLVMAFLDFHLILYVVWSSLIGFLLMMSVNRRTLWYVQIHFK